MAIRINPNKRDGVVQNELCAQILGCTLDKLSSAELDYVSKVVNYEI